ncbi:hypothetical protein [Thalassotalea sediminis]|nr:hypothetical protein [Thalassotalea sediminis]
MLSDIKKEDLAIDVAARNMLNSNEELFKPIKDDSGMIIDSGFMNSFIGL